MKPFFVFLLSVFILGTATGASLELPSVFSDHMVLQREKPVTLWGKGSPGKRVTVRFAGQRVATMIRADGTWMLTLEPLAVSKTGRELQVASGEDRITLKDVLVGDVWLCSGQSNMVWRVRQSKDADIEIASADYPQIRLYQVDRAATMEPRFSAGASWSVCQPETAAEFSAVGYSFGRDLHRILDVPIGLINSSWGGTPVIAWTRQEAVESNPHTAERLAEWEEEIANYDTLYAKYLEEMESFKKTSDVVTYHIDPGMSEEGVAYKEPDFDDSGWEVTQLPNTFEAGFGDMDGAVWYRKHVSLPDTMMGKDLELRLGAIDDFDETYVDGVYVGGHMDPAQNPYSIARKYKVPADLTREGELVFAVRVFDRVGDGGFTAGPKGMLLINESGDSLSLAGAWKYKIALKLEPAVGPWMVSGPSEPRGPNHPHRPAILANGMLTPVAPYTLKGAIWYQGEQDTHWAPDRYDERLELMLADWRDWWQQPDLPLGVVQLANFMAPADHPTDTPWAHLRDSQQRVSLNDPFVGLAVAIDIGEADDIHPVNKLDVGRRLARWALTDIYNVMDLSGGPVLASHRVEGNSLVLSFVNEGSGLRAFNGAPLVGFTIAGEDQVFHPAQAELIGKTKVRVKSDKVSQPVAVRYAWANNPVGANLSNQQRFPASPFRTDDWPLKE